MKLPANWRRRLRFFALEQILLPTSTPPLRMLVRSWRLRDKQDAVLRAMLAAPRVVIATWHGMFLHLLAYAPVALARGRRMVVLVSPSLDGRLLAAALARFGIDHVYGTSNARGVSGAREFIARIASGEIGIIAADGPRGPCCVAKRGPLEIAALADAQVYLVSTSAHRGLTLPSWDRSHLPPPFAGINLIVRPFTPSAADDLNTQVQAMQSEMRALARSIASPVLPPAYR
ncbi:MAG TPA: DUF374 domain-containing protein [Candidatus Binataceae bacterium]|nr:DUF374 domain-containing protein [Candidatus Binataceae bacterium]